jgi:tetrahydromethanopterin S-methyltransferase subunit G
MFQPQEIAAEFARINARLDRIERDLAARNAEK